MGQNMKGEETVVVDDDSVTTIAAAVGAGIPSNASVVAIKAKTDLIPASPAAVGSKMDLADSVNATGVADLKSKLGTLPASGNWSTATDITDYAAKLSETGPTALDATGGATPSALIAIPAGATSYCVGSVDSTRAAALTGNAAASNSPRTKSGELVPFGSAGFIPTKLDDNSTAPTHLYVVNTAAVAGWVWVEWFK